MKTLDLAGIWDISDSRGEYSLQGSVPGSVLYELEKAGHFGEEGAFFRDNNRKALQMMDKNFIYRRTFPVDDDFLNSETGEGRRVFLEADGLDTLTEIRINGVKVGETKNMHRVYRFELEDHLSVGENEIEIRFRNSLEYIAAEHARRPLMSEDEEGITTVPGFYTIRKSHCSYGWDWGPQMPDAGIWRAIRIARYDDGRFEDLRILQKHSDRSVVLDISAETELWKDSDYSVTGKVISPAGESIPFSFSPGETASLTIDNPMLWWPNGMGDQPLYRIEASLISGERILGTVEKTIGLRTLTIVRKPDQWGESFYFEANGIPLFARGANYIPEDVYLNRVSRERTAKLLDDCKDANFNCIRIWGGGVFPDDSFYDLCDRKGLIVWQDLMFACAIYDMLSDHFTENISGEIRDNLRRIRHHASLGLICGNNEMEWFFVDYDTFPQTKENEFEYIKQYHMVIPAIHEEICPEIFYWSSSPSSGGYFEEPNSPDKGDCHFWAVWHGNKDLTEYRNHYFRFMSEFGFESLPSMKTIESFSVPEDRNIFSPVMEEHQKRVGGNPKIVSYLAKYFRYPKDLDALAYVSQLSQSDAIRIGVEHWRRNRGRCMGSIYWQLNDNWPVASWSSIDYYGRWKALHYAVKRAYDNILLSIDGQGRRAAVHLSNESDRSVSGELSVRLISLDGSILYDETVVKSADRWSSSEVFVFELDESVDPGKVVLSASFHSGGMTFEAAHFFQIYKYLELEKPEISISWDNRDEGSREFVLTSDKPALYVELEFAGSDCQFSDNYFHLFPGEKKRVVLKPWNGQLPIDDTLRIRSLADSY